MDLAENKSSSSNHNERPQGILTVPRADYLLWCKRRMESCDNSNASSSSSSNGHFYTDAGCSSSSAMPLDNKKTTSTATTSAAARGSPFGFALPPELLLEILSYLKESQSALYAVSLVCRQWMFCAAPLLYRHAKIGDTFRYATFILTLTRNKQTLSYGSLVHTLDLAAGNKLFGRQANMDTTISTNNATSTTSSQGEATTANGTLPQQAMITATTTTTTTTARRSGVGILITPANDTTTTTTTATTTTPNGNQTMNLALNINNNNNNNDHNNNNNNVYNNNGIATTRLTATAAALANNNDAGWLQRQQQQQDFNNESEYYEARDMKHGHLFVTTSSLLQVARTCKNLTCLNMSLTTLFFDSMIAETGEYVSTLQHYAVQPGLTHILIPMSTVIETLGKECTQLQEVKMQRCDWVTAQTIWLWVTHCPKLVRLDARRSNKCSVKKLIANVLEAEPNNSSSSSGSSHQPQQQHRYHYPFQEQHYNHNAYADIHQDDLPQQQQQAMMDDTPMLDHSEEDEERVFFGTLRPRHNHQHQQQLRHPIQSQELLNVRVFRDGFDPLDAPLTQRLQQRRGSTSRRPSLSRRAAAAAAARASSSASSSQAEAAEEEGSSSSSSSNGTTEWRSLQQVVYDILKDAKELGADLSWFP